MNDDLCLLVTLLDDHDFLVRCAIKIKHGLNHPRLAYPMGPEARAQIADLLPSHVRCIGKIVDVETIHEVTA